MGACASRVSNRGQVGKRYKTWSTPSRPHRIPSYRWWCTNVLDDMTFESSYSWALIFCAYATVLRVHGNALLFGSNATDIQRLQRIQNWAAKLVCRASKCDHATPYFKELHWLPVRERITVKIWVYVYKCLNGTAPSYLSSCLSPHRPVRSSLRSASDTTRLKEPSSVKLLKSASSRTFSHFASQTWNALTISIRESDSLCKFK